MDFSPVYFRSKIYPPSILPTSEEYAQLKGWPEDERILLLVNLWLETIVARDTTNVKIMRTGENPVKAYDTQLTTFEAMFYSPYGDLDTTLNLVSESVDNANFNMSDIIAIILMSQYHLTSSSVESSSNRANITYLSGANTLEEIFVLMYGGSVLPWNLIHQMRRYAAVLYDHRHTKNYMLVVYLFSRGTLDLDVIDKFIDDLPYDRELTLDDIPDNEKYHFSPYISDIITLISEYYTSYLTGDNEKPVDIVPSIESDPFTVGMRRYHSRDIAKAYDLPPFEASRAELLVLVFTLINNDYSLRSLPLPKPFVVFTPVSQGDVYIGINTMIGKISLNDLIPELMLGIIAYLAQNDTDGQLREDTRYRQITDAYDCMNYGIQYTLTDKTDYIYDYVYTTIACVHLCEAIFRGLNPNNVTLKAVNKWVNPCDYRIRKLEALYRQILKVAPRVDLIPLYLDSYRERFDQKVDAEEDHMSLVVITPSAYFDNPRHINIGLTIAVMGATFSREIYDKYLVAVTNRLNLPYVPGTVRDYGDIYTYYGPDIELTSKISVQTMARSYAAWLTIQIKNSDKPNLRDYFNTYLINKQYDNVVSDFEEPANQYEAEKQKQWGWDGNTFQL